MLVFHGRTDKAVVDDIDIDIVVDLFIGLFGLFCEFEPEYFSIGIPISLADIGVNQIHIETNAYLFLPIIVLNLISILLHDFLPVVDNMN